MKVNEGTIQVKRFALIIKSILPLYSFESSSKIGAINLQGPHHSAQKSTMQGFEELNTSVSNEESVIFFKVWLSAMFTPHINKLFVRFLKGRNVTLFKDACKIQNR